MNLLEQAVRSWKSCIYWLEQGHNVFIIDSLINSSEYVVNTINELSIKQLIFLRVM